VPASYRKRLRDAGGIQVRPGPDSRPLQRPPSCGGNRRNRSTRAGRYAAAANRGRELVEARPDQPYLFYNLACCESLAGRSADAVEHLRRAIDMWEGCRDMASGDSDFDPIRAEPAFQALIR